MIQPTKIICVGRNYLEHIRELNNEVPDDMVLFFKPNSAISQQLISSHPTKNILEPLHYESEICFLYANHNLQAVGIGLDLTKRALQADLKAKGLPWEKAKCFNGAALFSEFVDMSLLKGNLNLTLHINDKLIQDAKVENMIYSPQQILKEIQLFTTLEDGDIIMTGTPSGVGKVTKGASFNCKLYDENDLLLEKSWIAL